MTPGTAQLLCQRQLRLVTAESCTAGMVAAVLGDVEGCGQWLEGAFVTYTERAKEAVLGIAPQDMQRYGLTSEEIAERMARGAVRHFQYGGGRPGRPTRWHTGRDGVLRLGLAPRALAGCQPCRSC